MVCPHAVTSNTTSFAELQQLAVQVVEVTQTGQLAEAMSLEIQTVNLVEPVPPPVDPTGGVRATNETSK